MLGVLRALQNAEHEVQVATHADFHPVLIDLGFEVLDSGLSEKDLLTERLRLWPDTAHEPPMHWAGRMFAEIAGPRMAADLDSLTTSARPDLVLFEEGEHGGPAFATTHGIACVRHGWGSPPALLPPVPATVLGHIDPCPPSLNPNAWIGPTRWPVRSSPPRIAQTSQRVDAWLAGRTRPVAYVSFGTVPLYAPPPRLLRRVIDSLLDAGLDVITTSRQPSPCLEDRVHETPFVDLTDVLPACTLVVCHGGAGTVLAALAHGLPLIVSPRGAPSQKRMADAVAARGVAVILDNETADVIDLIDAARNTERRMHARDVANEIASAPHPAEIAELLAEPL